MFSLPVFFSDTEGDTVGEIQAQRPTTKNVPDYSVCTNLHCKIEDSSDLPLTWRFKTLMTVSAIKLFVCTKQDLRTLKIVGSYRSYHIIDAKWLYLLIWHKMYDSFYKPCDGWIMKIE